MQVRLLRKDGDAGSLEIPEDESAGQNAATLVRKTRQGLLVTLANEEETVAGSSRIRRISIGTATPNRRRDSTISRTGSCSSLGSHDRNARQEHGRQGSIISTESSPGGDNPGVDSDDDGRSLSTFPNLVPCSVIRDPVSSWGSALWVSFFKHNFCVKPYIPREPRRDPSNRRLN